MHFKPASETIDTFHKHLYCAILCYYPYINFSGKDTNKITSQTHVTETK
jgi:hypothetical protein